jgi:hypothetical protein
MLFSRIYIGGGRMYLGSYFSKWALDKIRIFWFDSQS